MALDKKTKEREDHEITAEALALGGAAFGMSLITPWIENGATKEELKAIMNHLKKKYPAKKAKRRE